MSKLVWDAIGEHLYETGTKKGVLYPMANNAYPAGVAWNGLTAVTESPEGAEPTDIYADDIKYLTLRSAENFKATIEAYTYPEEFAECDGSASVLSGVKIGQQGRKAFGFSFVSTLGNDTELNEHGYMIHLIWGATASPSERSYQTINDSPEAITFSWEVNTVPVEVGTIDGVTYKPCACMTIDSTKFTGNDASKLEALEGVLYGKDADGQAQATTAWLPTPAQVINILKTGNVPNPPSA